MPPKSSPRKSLSTASNNTDNDSTDSIDKPMWDTSPITKPRYLIRMARWLPDQDERFRILIETGTTTQKTSTVVTSINHMDRHRHGLLPRGTFQKPTLVRHTDYDILGFPSDSDATRDDDKARYFINPDIVNKVAAEMLTTILGTVEDEETAEELRRACGGNGLVLLQIWEAERAKAAGDDTGNLGESIINEINDLLDTGLAEPTVSAFNAFKTSLRQLILTLPNDLQSGWPDTVVARKLAKAVKDLGPLIQTKLENEMRHEKANGDLKKTRDACVQVLSSLELDEINEARRNGRANARSEHTDSRRATHITARQILRGNLSVEFCQAKKKTSPYQLHSQS